MKTAMQETSLDAYWELVRSKNIQRMEGGVLTAIEHLGACTNRDIATFLKWDISSVTGRTNGLVKHGLVRPDGKKLQNGRKAIVWTLNK